MINIVVLLAKGDINYGVCFLVLFLVVLVFGIRFASKGLMSEPNRKECKHVSEIIDGHHTHISPRRKNKILMLFLEWQTTQSIILNNTPDERWEELGQCNTNSSFYLYKPNYLNDPPEKGHHPTMKLFMKDVFTEAFYSKERSDIFLLNYIVKLLIFKGITPEESSKFYIYKKNHFVNSKIDKGEIIQFDIYHDIRK